MGDVPTHVALLRGINLGGRNRVAMADLRHVVTSLGHTEVATYIQSGNVAFTATGEQSDAKALAEALEHAIAEALSVRPRVLVLPGANWRKWSGEPCSCAHPMGWGEASWPRNSPGPEGPWPPADRVRRATGRRWAGCSPSASIPDH